jgi:hypothetical protein
MLILGGRIVCLCEATLAPVYRVHTDSDDASPVQAARVVLQLQLEDCNSCCYYHHRRDGVIQPAAVITVSHVTTCLSQCLILYNALCKVNHVHAQRTYTATMLLVSLLKVLWIHKGSCITLGSSLLLTSPAVQTML